MSRKVVIVGGVAGGATAAARIRRLDEQAEIVVFERSGYISYANCGLPYYVGGVITDPEELTLQDPESFYARFRVVMKVRHEVTAIHPEEKTVEVKNLETGETFSESYDSLLLAPGARPTVPDLPGIDSERIFKLRTVEDTFTLRERVVKYQPKRAAVIGGGFIGLETAENLRHAGLEVTILQRPRQVLSPLDADMASFVHGELRAHGVTLVILAGFMRILSPYFVQEFPGRILNIHPSLLPSFGGAHAHRDVLAYGVKVSGCTIHFVDEGMDSGPIILQTAVPVLDGDDEDTLAARVLEREHKLYPRAIELFLNGKLKIEGRKVRILE